MKLYIPEIQTYFKKYFHLFVFFFVLNIHNFSKNITKCKTIENIRTELKGGHSSTKQGRLLSIQLKR